MEIVFWYLYILLISPCDKLDTAGGKKKKRSSAVRMLTHFKKKSSQTLHENAQET